ncbi:MAG: 30S ribosomal protein S8 [Candidatus Aenigmatarchaeota archaeon]|nr:MAG: 30S ribosomal protein S8 [Candidatus Aenigmarchaeota archaeon]
MKHDLLADTFTVIKNSEGIGKRECVVPSSNIIKEILKLMQKNKYIGSFEFIDDGKSGKFRVELLGRINDCGVIRPRFYLKKDEFISWEKRFLPSVNVGLLFVTTSKGIIDHREAKKKGVGGALLGYIY